MKNSKESKSRFPLSGKHPTEYPINSHEDAICVDIAIALQESNMKFILVRRHQLGGIYEIEVIFSIVKDMMHRGTCRNPRKLFNCLLTKELKKCFGS